MRWTVLALPILLVACAEGGTSNAEDVDLSGVNVEAIAQCVRDNAAPEEQALIDAGGPDAEAMTLSILQRPSTGECLAASDTGLETIS